MSSAKVAIEMFFPTLPKPGSLSDKKDSNQIRADLETLLMADPLVVKGFHIADGAGAWFDKAWENDAVWRITVFGHPRFISNLRNPKNLNGPERRFVARIAQLSCVQMGHQAFWCILNNNLLEEWSATGVVLADRLIRYEKILGNDEPK